MFPALPYGLAPYFTAFPGTVTLRVATYAAVLRDVLDSLKHAGFRRVLITSNWAAAALIAAPAAFRADTPIAVIVLVLAIGGFVRSIQFTATNTVAFADIPQSSISRATTG